MNDYADLEIGLHRRDVNYYAVDLRFIHQEKESEADVRLVRGSDLPLARFDFDHLRSLKLNTQAYGESLTAMLFAHPDVRTAFDKVFTIAQSRDMPLRVRLFIGPSAPDLHTLRWEMLCFPFPTSAQDTTKQTERNTVPTDVQCGDTLLTNEHILFSRYLSSNDWRPVRLRPKSDLRALVVVANPTDLHDFGPDGSPLAPVDVAGEITRARESLKSIATTILVGGNTHVETLHATSSAPPSETLHATSLQKNGATLDNLITYLRDGDGYDILYLVAHGASVEGDPALWLEDEQGNAAVVSGHKLVQHMRDLRQRPRLVVLASCQSAGSGDERHSQDGGVLTALGPRLAEIGIPAVLAMQENVTMQTVATFLPIFFSELLKDGQIDRAMTVARGTLVRQQRPDWWVPVLIMRLKSGCIWYVPGFGDDRKDFRKWPALIRNIRDGNCTPILGSHVSDILGTQTEIARQWADNYTYPLEPYRCELLSQVAQYLAISQDPQFPRSELLEYLKIELLHRYCDLIPEEQRDLPMNDLFEVIGNARRTQPLDPYTVLAHLPFRVYITANFTNLLADALRGSGKHPRIEVCRWHSELQDSIPSIYDEEPDYEPDVDHPLIYHLFGHLDYLDSLVITEDDYFDYLTGLSSNKEVIPLVVRALLADSGLLFLGFQPDDWDFRIVLRSLMNQGGRGRRKRYAHVSAQIAPEDHRIIEPVRAREYLETYFQHSDIDIFWGTVEDFVKELDKRWQKR